MKNENVNSSLWIEVDDSLSSMNARARLDNDTELTAEEQAVAKDVEALYSVYQYGLELEGRGLSSEDISKKVVEKLTEVTPHLTPERNSYPPYDVSVER